MLINVKEVLGRKILASDGDIGQIEDLYFDSQDWVLRYLVVDTGPWILGRKVLISYHALQNRTWGTEGIPVNLTREQVKNSPAMDLAEPVSRQHEVDLYGYYGWPAYWQVPIINPMGVSAPFIPTTPVAVPEEQEVISEDRDNLQLNYLQSFKKVAGYKVHGRDGDIGHIEDFVIEDEDWTINYFIVDTGGWFQKGNHVMLAPHWITQIDADESKVYVDLKKDTIRSSPEFEPKDVMQND